MARTLTTTKALLALSRRPDAGSAEIEAAIADAGELVTRTEAEHQAAGEGYRTALLSDDPKAAVAAREKVTAAEVEVDRVRSAVAALRDRLCPAREAEAEAARAARHAEAGKAVEAARRRLLKEYGPAAATIAAVLVDVAAAAELAAAANADLPAGAAPVEHPEAVLATPSLPRQELGRERVELWTFQSTGVIYDETKPGNGPVTTSGGDVGRIFSSDHDRANPTPMRRRRFQRVRVHPATPGRAAPLLVDVVHLPGLRESDPAHFPASTRPAPASGRPVVIEHELAD